MLAVAGRKNVHNGCRVRGPEAILVGTEGTRLMQRTNLSNDRRLIFTFVGVE